MPEEFQADAYRFKYRLKLCRESGRLNELQADLVMKFILHLGEGGYSPSNTGNLEDLFFYTLLDTNNHNQAFAQLIADSDKRVHVNHDRKFAFPLAADYGVRKNSMSEMEGFSDLDKMLVAHTLVAFGSQYRKRFVMEFAQTTGDGSATFLLRSALQAQHMPSSTFIMSRMQGHYPWVTDAYLEAGYSEWIAKRTQDFYMHAAEFDPEWEESFAKGEAPHCVEYGLWQKHFLDFRKQLTPELQYQLRTDKTTNFLTGTMSSGKWMNILVAQGDVESPQDFPLALSNLLNRYSNEFVKLEDRPISEIIDLWEANGIKDFGIYFDRDELAVPASPTPEKADLMISQFESAKTARSLVESGDGNPSIS